MISIVSMKNPKAPRLKSNGNTRESLKYPDISMYRMLADAAAKFTSNTAYDFMGTTVSFRRFISKIDRAARAMAAFDVKQGDVVTIISANIPEALIVIYATNKLGAIANIVHPLSSEADIKHALALTNSKLLFVMDVAYATAKKALGETSVHDVVILSARDSLFGLMRIGYDVTQGRKVGWIPPADRQFTYREFLTQGRRIHRDLEAKTGKKDPAAILYSGGTTGTPKGILLNNGAFNAYVPQMKVIAPDILAPGTSILGVLPIFHGFGLGVGIHGTMCNGVTNILLPKFDPKAFPGVLAHKKPNIILGVPTLFEAFLSNKKIAKLDLSFITMMVSGGDALPNSLKHKCDAFFHEHGVKTEILQGYGLTEYLAGICFCPLDQVRLGSIGIPVSDAFVKIVEPETDIEKPIGEVGEMVVRGPSTMMCYLNEEEETNRALRTHSDGHVWLHSGDLGHVDEDGYFFFDARLKRLIISSGYNVYPGHIEEVIGQLDEVLLATVVGMEDKYRGQVAKAFVVLRDGHKPTKALKRKIMDHCRANLPKYSLPWVLEFRDALPKTKLNKVAYRELK